MAVQFIRELVVDALKATNVPNIVKDATLDQFILRDLKVNLSDLSLDSLATMEFCIYIEVNHNISIIPDTIHDYETLNELANDIQERMQ